MWDLNSETLRSMRATTSKLLVKLYQPWCKACKKFSPEFKRAAKISEDLGLGIVFAQVNLQQSPDLLTEFDIDTFPRILFWANRFSGEKGFKRYFKSYGLKADRLIKWLRSRIDYASTLSSVNNIMCDSMFQCDDGMCVPFENVCDEYNQCRDGSDERFCASLEGNTDINYNTAFYPDDTSSSIIRPTFNPIRTWEENDLYPINVMPDVIVTIPTMQPTPRNPILPERNENDFVQVDGTSCDFKCNDGTCKSNDRRCDGVLDCLDGIDETNCGVCKRTDFTCVSGNGNECIPYLKRCDENVDCSDGSDEWNCEGIKLIK